MQRLNEIVELYLRMDTNYALLITGEWGVGKTYYYKHVLKDLISKTPILRDDEKKYRPILISLFGLHSVEEVQSEIFLRLYPLLKGFKLCAPLGKAVMKGILLLKGSEQYGKLVDELEESAKTYSKKRLINFEELLICFDDLERISPSLNIEELLGYINSLVENDNVKVLIIANQGKGSLSEEMYNKLKEKVIGNTIEFIPSDSESYDSILKARFSGFPIYNNFLKAYKDFVLEVFFEKSSNLRTLSFALSYFHTVFSEVELRFLNEKALKEKQDEILLSLLKFALVLSIEYKDSRITYKKRNGLDDSDVIDWSVVLPYAISRNAKTENDTEITKTYREKFLDDYYVNQKYNFYCSIYDYITGGKAFDCSLLIAELNKYYYIKDDVTQPQYEIYNKLHYPSCFHLKNGEYRKKTFMMLNYAYTGTYDIKDYMTIFHFATRFGNPLKLSLDKLCKRLINGMIRSYKNCKHIPILGFHLTIPPDIEYPQFQSQIRQTALDLNDKILAENTKEESRQLEILYYKSFDEFYIEIFSKDQYLTSPILADFNVKRFYSFFIQSAPKRRWEISRFFVDRYASKVIDNLTEEIPFLRCLLERVKKKSKQFLSNNLESYVVSEFVKNLESAIEKMAPSG